MGLRKSLITCLCTLFICASSLAQENPVKSDSTKIYQEIETYSKGSKFKTFLYHLIFRSTPKYEEDTRKEPVQKNYRSFQGKIIRKIRIITLDPFSYRINDTVMRSDAFFNKAGNALHVKSKQLTIRNFLLIKENEPLNSYYVRESERLIRSQRFVHDVDFNVKLTKPRSDSVDITIRELDTWSIAPRLLLNTSRIRVGLTDINFIGTGHEFQNLFSRDMNTGLNSFNTSYTIPNIKATYIQTIFRYGIDSYGNRRKSLSINRSFYSPSVKWAGGFSIGSHVARDSLVNTSPLYVPLNLEYHTQDIWGGKAIRIFSEVEKGDLITNLIISLRYLRIRYPQKPVSDSSNIYSNVDFYLTSLSLSSRSYVQDKYIFKYGLVEDVPIGKVYEITGGYQYRVHEIRPYLGFRIINGNYYRWGYVSSEINFGTFFKGSSAEQGVINIGIDYFTRLFEKGSWKFRQFVKPQMTFGINRFSYDTLTLNDRYGINGFNSPVLSGTNRFLLTLQTQSYAPWNLAGFNFGPYFSGSVGMIGNSTNGIYQGKLYTQIGFGVLIRNPYLVFNVFEISFSFYPSIPGNGNNIIKFNSLRTTDFGFRDFETGKPGQAIYR